MKPLFLRYIATCVVCAVLPLCVFSQVIINEAVSSNIEITDQFDKSPDWFELYNTGTDTVHLINFSVSDSPDAVSGISLPDVSLPPAGFFIIKASGKNLAYEPEAPFHVPFRIASEGEVLYLFSGGNIADSLAIPAGLLGYSVGKSNDSDAVVVFDSLTPGAQNAAYSFTGIAQNNLTFSHPGGICTPLALEISNIPPGSIVRYTLDATEPDGDSPQYTAPLGITENTVVRARVFTPGAIPSAVESRTYLTDAAHDLPVISLVTEPDNFFDEEDGIYVLGAGYEGVPPYFGSNIWEDWERPIHVSMYDTDNQPLFDINAGVKIFGGYTRSRPQRSLAITARSYYGAGEIDYPVFSDRPYTSYKSFVLRNSGNDWLRIGLRDALTTSMCADLDIELQAYRPVVTYLNGEYFGLYNLRERTNEHKPAQKFNISPDSIDLLERNGLAAEGSADDYLALLDFVENNDLTVAENYATAAAEIDIDNYALYLAFQTYIGNRDWPQKNIKFWRNRNGGKWRWILYDTDRSTSIYYMHINYITRLFDPENAQWYSSLPSRMIENETFRHKFINRAADLMNSIFLPEVTEAHIEYGISEIETEIQTHYEHWESEEPFDPVWYERIDEFKQFFTNRQPVFKEDILEEFGLNAYHALEVENPQIAAGHIQVNTLTVTDSLWQGDYFEGVPVSITAVPAQGYTFVEWVGDTLTQEAALSVNLTDSVHLTAVFTVTGTTSENIVINEINYKSSGEVPTGDWIELQNTGNTTVDLSGWSLQDNNPENEFTFPAGTNIEAGDFLLLAKDSADFKAVYPDLMVSGAFDFGLSSDGDAVKLYDSFGTLTDSVAWLPTAPWPVAANGTGSTLELKLNQTANDSAENWHSLNPFGSPGQANILLISGLQQTFEESTFTIFPNPSSVGAEVFFAYQTADNTDFTVSIFDTQGRRVRSVEYTGATAAETLTLRTASRNLAKGVYFVTFRQNDLLQTVKMVRL